MQHSYDVVDDETAAYEAMYSNQEQVLSLSHPPLSLSSLLQYNNICLAFIFFFKTIQI